MHDHLLRASNADEKLGLVELFSGETPEGERLWAYVSIRPSLYAAYKLAQAEGAEINLPAFGHILLSGPGAEPSAAAKALLEKKYGIRHDLAAQLDSAFRAHKRGQAS